MLKKGDVILLLIVVLGILSSVLFGRGVASSLSSTGVKTENEGVTAVIKQDEAVIRTIDLSDLKKREEIRISGLYQATIVAEKNRIRFIESGCPDKICVKTGWISQPGEIAVCLPNKVIIKLEKKR